MSSIKIVLAGCHGTGKSRICEKIVAFQFAKELLKFYGKRLGTDVLPEDITKCYADLDLAFIPEQFREVVKDLMLLETNTLKQTEEITLATYAKQLYLENLYTAQGKNILCDRSVLDTFVYHRYFDKNNIDESFRYFDYAILQAVDFCEKTYSKIYLIEPSDREIEDDGFRMTDKKQQLEIHKLFLEYFKYFDNVEIINQEDAHKPEFIEKVVKGFSL